MTRRDHLPDVDRITLTVVAVYLAYFVFAWSAALDPPPTHTSGVLAALLGVSHLLIWACAIGWTLLPVVLLVAMHRS